MRSATSASTACTRTRPATRASPTLLPGDPERTRSAIACRPMAHLRQGHGGQAAPLVAERLTRLFDDRVAVRDVTLSVNAGEIVALLGPNGAGKTTTMRMLAGLILPTAGRISINHIELSEADFGPGASGGGAAYRGAWPMGTAHRPPQPADLRAPARPRRSEVAGRRDVADRRSDRSRRRSCRETVEGPQATRGDRARLAA